MQTFTFYGFIDEVEYVWLSRGDQSIHCRTDGLANERSPFAIWIQADCIEAAHFLKTVDNPPRLTDQAYRTVDAVAERKALLHRLVGQKSKLRTLYLTATRDLHTFKTWRRRLQPSTWHRFTVSYADERWIDISANNSIPPRPQSRWVLLADDPYTSDARIVDKWRIGRVPARIAEDLEEVISLNHLDDIDISGGGGDAGGSVILPPPTPFHPPPVITYDPGQQTAHPLWVLEPWMQYDSERDGTLDLYYDSEKHQWSFCHRGRLYTNSTLSNTASWLQHEDGERYQLLEIHGRVLLVREFIVQQERNLVYRSSRTQRAKITH